MCDLDRYLLPTELPEVVVRRHWASQAGATVIYAALTGLACFALVYLPPGSAVSYVGVVLLLGAATWYIWMLLSWRAERFVITDKRVLLISGLLTKRVAIMPLSKVTDLTYERTVAGRILGFGAFVMESAGQQQALSRVDFLPTPDRLYQQVSGLLFGPRSRRVHAEEYLAEAPVPEHRGPGRRGPRPPTHRGQRRQVGYPEQNEQVTAPLPRLR